MKIRTILLLSGAALFLGFSIPAAEGAMQTVPQMEAAPGKVGAATERALPQLGEAQMGAAVMPPGPEGGPCPHPQSLSLTGNSGGVVHSSTGDFAAVHPGAWAAGFNDMTANHSFGYTFQWRNPTGGPCCEITKAVLTMVLKCHADIPQNDAWAMWNGTSWVGGTIGWPANCNGQTKTVSVPISFPTGPNSSVGAFMNTNHRLSFYVEDDTAVVSAKLDMRMCCLDKF